MALGILPTFFLVGPLALPALLLVAALAGLALFLRRWLVLLLVAASACLLAWGQAWFRSRLAGYGWETPERLWQTVAALAALGAAWSWRRHHADADEERVPGKGTGWALGLGGALLIALGLLAKAYARVFLPAGIVLFAGGVYTSQIALRTSRRAPAAETVMLALLTLTALACAYTPPREVETPAVVWMFEPPQRGAVVSSPVLASDRLYVALVRDTGAGTSTGAVYCLEATTGKVRWSFDDGGAMLHVYSTPCVAQGRLYVGEGMHENLECKLYCLDLDTGRKLWDFRTAGHVESSPTVAGDLVYFGAGDDGLYALESATGKKRWQFREGLHLDTSPLVAPGRVYGGSGPSERFKRTEAFCLDARTGTPLWRVQTDLPVWGSPAEQEGRVYFGLGNGRLVEDRGGRAAPAGGVLCLDASSGRLRWWRDLEDAVLQRVTLANDRVYAGTRAGDCWCLDAHDGQVLWRERLGSPILTRPAVIERSVFVAARDGVLTCLDSASGRRTWFFDWARQSGTEPRLLASPAVNRHAGGGYTIFLAGELRNPVTSAAAVVRLQAP